MVISTIIASDAIEHCLSSGGHQELGHAAPFSGFTRALLRAAPKRIAIHYVLPQLQYRLPTMLKMTPAASKNSRAACLQI